jgi:GT2 family glycosyltransferase
MDSKQKPQLSIIIVTWNTSQITQKCVETINKYIPNQEIIVVDNGSQDNTVQLLSKIKNVKVIENHVNLGFAKANNIGFKYTTSDYIVFMNSDIELIDKSFLDMTNYFKNNPNIGLIGPKFLNPDLTPQASVFPPQTALNAFKEFWLNQKDAYSKYLPNTKEPTKVSYISGGCILVNKDFFQKIGKWNEKYFFYFEDMDLCRQVRRLRKEIIFYPKCLVIHRHGSSGKKLADSQNQWRRLVPSSIKFHGYLKHYFINFIIWSGQKWQKPTK